MKTIAVIEASSVGALGLSSQWHCDLDGKSLLARTVEAIQNTDLFSNIVVATNLDMLLKTSNALQGVKVNIFQHSISEPIKRQQRRAKRKFALNGWRGGIDSTYLFGELSHPELLLEVAKKYCADAVVQFDAEAPFIDADIVNGMLSCLQDSIAFGAAFTSAPPGLGMQVYTCDKLQSLVESQKTLDEMIAYNPSYLLDEPLISSYCYTVALDISTVRQRFAANSPRLKDLVFSLWKSLNSKQRQDAFAVVNQYQTMFVNGELVNVFPREIEWELSAKFSVNDSLRPQSIRTDFADLKVIKNRLAECSSWQDVCLNLGAHGEPLLYPYLADVLNIAKQSKIWATHITTYGADLTESLVDTIKVNAPDVISIKLDAHSPALWNKFKSGFDFTKIVEQIQMAQELLPNTIFIPTFIKLRENISEMEDFFDYWYQKTGWAVIEGFNDYCASMEDRNPLRLLPSQRRPCMSLMEQLIIYSDGSIPVCKQDINADFAIANIADISIEQAWGKLGDYRKTHIDGHFQKYEMCNKCKDWAHL